MKKFLLILVSFLLVFIVGGVAGALTLTDTTVFTESTALGLTESGDWWWGEIDTGVYEYGVSTAFLEDGEFSVTLISLIGDFFIDQSVLSIDFDPVDSLGRRDDVSPVPEPATMVLFGVGLVGMAAIGRKKFLKHG